MPAPASPKIYHIVHHDKLPAIIASGGLLSDAALIASGAMPGTSIGMGSIKARRLRLPVDALPGVSVGSCVPFYLCSRSLMLYVIHMQNHADLEYRGGQEPIVHLEADLRATVAWAQANHVGWAVSLGNAGAVFTEFRASLDVLAQIDWPKVHARDFRPPEVKAAKQSEFLFAGRFPWELVERIGVRTHAVAAQVGAAFPAASHRPRVEVRTDWYY